MTAKYFVSFLGCILFMLFNNLVLFTIEFSNVYKIYSTINTQNQDDRQTNNKGLSGKLKVENNQTEQLQISSVSNRGTNTKFRTEENEKEVAQDLRMIDFRRSSVDTRTANILSMDRLPFLTNYKNPCWFQTAYKFPTYHLEHKFFKNIQKSITQLRFDNKNQLQIKHGQYYELKCIPYVYVIGPQKSGTTDLFNKMALHPKIVPGLYKEPHWWSRSRIYPEYNTTLAEYSDLYNVASELIIRWVTNKTTNYHSHITVDATPELIWDNWLWREQKENFNMTEPKYLTPHYIRSVVPQARIIAMLRNPTDRLFSDYKYFQGDGSIYEFHKLVMDGIKWLNNCYASPDKTRKQCIYDPIGYHLPLGRFWDPVVRLRMGLYSEFLVDWFDVFPKEQLKIFKMEDYSANQVQVLNDVFQFLGLENMPKNMEQKLAETTEVFNKRRIKSYGMWNKTENVLNNFYKPFNAKLTQLLGDDKIWWST